ncbi:hypothetical protein [Cryobacterium ruanii]|uniref:Uncharacterized protein n=1 Tax=Cryobacterium ruanii TaxID=1259197 RepID=A0A4R9ATR8_9MICO|nr:hypothetical protein [Cryobacterium ruanii]TFD69819.1 hypothetical protein E3T47_00325 [Cryobacterium ruanii]
MLAADHGVGDVRELTGAANGAVLLAARMGLGHAAARLLLHMALECWDDGDNPGGDYYATRESSAIALGYLASKNGSEPAAHAVKRAVAELVALGSVERVRSGGRGQAAEFNLHVDSAKPGTVRRHESYVILLPRRGKSGGRFLTL